MALLALGIRWSVNLLPLSHAVTAFTVERWIAHGAPAGSTVADVRYFFEKHAIAYEGPDSATNLCRRTPAVDEHFSGRVMLGRIPQHDLFGNEGIEIIFYVDRNGRVVCSYVSTWATYL